ncbi:MAG: Nif3-like dinuclear metal center hexameric protein [Dehalococcoidales bacterium]|nr:Nif3-like dinuclear metal center hexameric protein [Dehalococcoidales bacterium]
MNIADCRLYLFDLFNLLEEIPGEFEFTSTACEDIHRLGYATNLTPKVVRNAIRKNIDLIVTHHDAWEFYYGMKQECLSEMNEHGISHVYAHLPLDMAEFGPVSALTEKLGADPGETLYDNAGNLLGRTGIYKQPVSFDWLVGKIESVCEEKVLTWKNNRRPVRKICALPGGAVLTGYVKAAVDAGCNVYITGEKTLYTVEYATYTGINLIVGSHTFTEIFGVENLANLLAERFPELEITRITEPHLEAGPSQ